MATKKKKDENLIKKKNIPINKKINGNIKSIMNHINTLAYGADDHTDSEELNSLFNTILTDEISVFGKTDGSSTDSFLAKLFEAERNTGRLGKNNTYQSYNVFDDSVADTSIRSMLDESYRNRMLKQMDLHEVSNQLIELREAILVTRDAITSSDVVDGKMTRILNFSSTSDSVDEYITTVEAMEKKFNLQDKIKNFIIPKTLSYGEYYLNIIPYKKIFADFMKVKDTMANGTNKNYYSETTLYDYIKGEEIYTESTNKKLYNRKTSQFASEIGSMYIEQVISDGDTSEPELRKLRTESMNNLTENVDAILKNITICNDPMPICVMKEGVEAMEYYIENFINPLTFEERGSKSDIGSEAYFNQFSSKSSEGAYGLDNRKNKKEKDIEKEFGDIKDCYIKLMEPLSLIPINVMNRRIGYYYIQKQSISPITGTISTSISTTQLDPARSNRTIVNAIANKIVGAFDKSFLNKNIEFKELIVDALMFHNITENRIRFQFIPADYVCRFKVSEDENGYGTSIVEPSLFYAKLYLMYMLFKFMSTILYSNDQRVNYIRTSGLDTDVRKKVEEIARTKQQRQINIMDMFSYTSMVNKLGLGAEQYIPTGRSGERGIETEILSGQEVPISTDFMDHLRGSYILGTGVPEAILNHMKESEYAKNVEMANTRFVGRVIGYQFDFNTDITTMYKKLMNWSTDIPPEIVETFEFTFAPPKNASNQIKAEMIGNFDAFSKWYIGARIGANNVDDPEYAPLVAEVSLQLAHILLTGINFVELDKVYKEALAKVEQDKLKPNGNGNVSDDDIFNT